MNEPLPAKGNSDALALSSKVHPLHHTPELLLGLVFLGFTLCISLAGWSYWKNQEQALERAAESELAAVADLKVDQIAHWRHDRLSDARLLADAGLVQAAATQFLAQPNDAQARARLHDWMGAFQRHTGCRRVILLDTNLQPRIGAPDGETWVGPLAAKNARDAMTANQVVFSDLHVSSVSGQPNLDLLVPVTAGAGETSPATAEGVFMVEVDPQEHLFPSIQSWPTPSRTAETLLVRREGDEVVYLNDLRHRTNTALRLRMSLARKELPASQAVLGFEGVTRGRDYRGEAVLAATRRVPDSPWFLLAKRDEAEIRGLLWRQTWIVGAMMGGLILAGGLGVRLVWRNREHRFALRELEASKQTEEALRQSAERFRSFTAASFEGILISERGRIADLNEQLAGLLGYPREELVGRELLTLVAPESRGVVADAIQNVRETAYECQVVRKDGKAITVEAQARSTLWEGRKVRIAAVRDITERKLAEAKLIQTQSELLFASRMAGMAEVATSVLHNVGNVLNSINISTSLVSDQVRQSRITNLARAAALMREHSADLGTYLTTDPKGRQLPAYLGQLADVLTQERTSLLEELDALRKNVEHIRDIVAMQQSYAKVTGTREQVSVAALVEDALRMNVGALERHQVRVTREYDPDQVPVITVEKHKVLQILVNLIRNAKYACEESGQPDRLLTLRIAHDAQRVRIEVADNGVGIPAENLARIFTHGFTTRKHGHGFGLHSGVTAAREMGGSLRAQSDGRGKGATFILELPATSVPAPVRETDSVLA